MDHFLCNILATGDELLYFSVVNHLIPLQSFPRPLHTMDNWEGKNYNV
jgi:hypothetical protein